MKKWTAGFLAASHLLFINILNAQENEAPSRSDQGMWQTLIMIGIAMVFFYFILWRPEQKRRKALEEQRNKMQKGDKVTAMGIIGTVSRVQEHTVILKMFDGSKIEVLKGAITDVSHGTGSDEKDEETRRD